MSSNSCEKHTKFNDDCARCKEIKYNLLKDQIIQVLGESNKDTLQEFIDLHNDLVVENIFNLIFDKNKHLKNLIE